MPGESINREALPQDLEAYGREARGTSVEAWLQRRPYPFLLFAKSALWDKSLLMAAASGGGGETRIVRYDVLEGGMAFLSPIKKRAGDVAPRVILGRATANDLVVPVGSISSKHLAFIPPSKLDGAWSAEDLGSTNGTWLNELKLEPTQPVEIPDGEYFRLGGNLIAWFLTSTKMWSLFQKPAELKQLTDL
jgi:hypothetical protein